MRSFTLRIVTTVVSLALALAALEIALRFNGDEYRDLASGDLVRGYFPGLYDYHPRLGWIPRPGANAVKWGVPVRIGPDGIRLNGHPLDPSKTQSHVLAVGDSFTFGDEVGDAETWPAHLETLLHAHPGTSGYEVLNAGVSSYGLDQMVLRAEDLVPKYHPRLVIVSFINDDIARCLQYIRHGVSKPYFVPTPEGLELRNVPTPPPRPFNLSFLMRHSALITLLARGPVRTLLTAGTVAESRMDGRLPLSDIVTGLFTRLLALKARYGFHLAVLAQPTDVTDAPDAPAVAILDSVRRSGDETMAAVDAFGAIRAHAASHDQDQEAFFHFEFDGHMSSAGNQFIAETVLPAVSAFLEGSR